MTQPITDETSGKPARLSKVNSGNVPETGQVPGHLFFELSEDEQSFSIHQTKENGNTIPLGGLDNEKVEGWCPPEGSPVLEGQVVVGEDSRQYIAIVDTTMPASFPSPDFEEYSPPMNVYSSHAEIREAEVPESVDVIDLHIRMHNPLTLQQFPNDIGVDSDIIVQFVRDVEKQALLDSGTISEAEATQVAAVRSSDGAIWKPVEPYTPQHFGARGWQGLDTPYLVSDFFGTLAEAQEHFLNATALDVSMDAVAIQKMIDALRFSQAQHIVTTEVVQNDIAWHFPRAMYSVKNQGIDFTEMRQHNWKYLTGDAAIIFFDTPDKIGWDAFGTRKMNISGITFVGLRNKEQANTRVPLVVFAHGRSGRTTNPLRPADSHRFDCEFTGVASLGLVYNFAAENTNYGDTNIKNYLGRETTDPLGVGTANRSYCLLLDGSAHYSQVVQSEYTSNQVSPFVWQSFLQVTCDNADFRHFGFGSGVFATGGASHNLEDAYIAVHEPNTPAIEIMYTNDLEQHQSLVLPKIAETDGGDLDPLTGLNTFVEFRARTVGANQPTNLDVTFANVEGVYSNTQALFLFRVDNSLNSVTMRNLTIYVHETFRDTPGQVMFGNPGRIHVLDGDIHCYEEQALTYCNVNALATFTGRLHVPEISPSSLRQGEDYELITPQNKFFKNGIKYMANSANLFLARLLDESGTFIQGLRYTGAQLFHERAGMPSYALETQGVEIVARNPVLNGNHVNTINNIPDNGFRLGPVGSLVITNPSATNPAVAHLDLSALMRIDSEPHPNSVQCTAHVQLDKGDGNLNLEIVMWDQYHNSSGTAGARQFSSVSNNVLFDTVEIPPGGSITVRARIDFTQDDLTNVNAQGVTFNLSGQLRITGSVQTLIP